MPNIDSAFFIGSTHHVNQDYAISGVKNNIPYCIVSDGCSSSENTDFGSRLLSLACVNYIDKIEHNILFSNLIINTAEISRKNIGINPSSLDATLLVAAIVNGILYIRAYGDGVIFIKRKYDKDLLIKISYKQNAPYYLSYLLNKERSKEYVNVIGSTIAIVNENEKELHFDPWYNASFTADSIDSCTLFSDGVDSFKQTITTETNISTKPIQLEEVINNFVNYNSTNGEFVKRKASKVIKTLKANNIVNYDDLSIGTIIP